LHPSEIIKDDWCERASWYLLNGRTLSDEETKRPSGRLSSIFEEGHAIHAKWQTWWEEMGILYGVWYNAALATVSWSTGPPSTAEGWVYREVPLVDNALRIAGHADGWLINLPDGGEDLLPEIKSIGTGTIRMGNPSLLGSSLEESFKNIRRPFPDHIKQANLYGVLLHRMKAANGFQPEPPTKIIFIYECKANQEPKEFIVEMDEGQVAPVLERAAWLVERLDGKVPVPCNIGGSKLCPKCKPFEE
jgi:hypothetical protein